MDLSLRNFVIKIIDYYQDDNELKANYIPLTIYDINNSSNITGTYNEKLTEKENSQYSLSFSIEMFINGTRNPFIDYLVNDRKLRLIINNDEIIDFFITSRKPTINNKGISYSIECQDAFSYQHSKQKIDIDFSTEDELIWSKIGPKTIRELTNKILQLGNSSWKLDENINNTYYQFPDNLYNTSGEMKVSLELTNTNVYNAIIEISKLFNAIIRLDFDNKIISFINKEKMNYKGLRLRPNINLSNFSYSDKADSLYNIMHVSGGEDANGSYISLLPDMPVTLTTIFIELENPSNNLNADTIANTKYYLLPTYYYIVNNKGIEEYYHKYMKSDGKAEYIKYEGSNIELNWHKTKTINELKNTILYLYSGSDKSRTDISDYTLLSNYFDELKKTPQASSFLFDFSYWKDNKLISENRYNSLMNSLLIDYRNINLTYLSYVKLYNILSYQLSKKIKVEEELIAQMAAEDETRANIKDDKNDNSQLAYIYYRSGTIKDEIIKEDEIITNYYLPVGIVWIEDPYIKVKYGKSYGDVNISYGLPDLPSIVNIKNFYYKYEGKIEGIQAKDYNYNENTIILDANIDTDKLNNDLMIYANIKDIEQMLKNYYANNPNSKFYEADGNTVYNLAMLESQVYQLWDSNYYYYYQILEGKNWLVNKKQEIFNKRVECENKKNSIIGKLIAKFGNNWKDINSDLLNSTNMESYIEYSYLIEELNNISIYIGGTGTRKYENGEYYTFKGFYDYYLICLNTIENKEGNNEISLKDKIKNLEDKREQFWNSLYKNYGDIIRETKYSDEDQLSSTGLYMSAYKQFSAYKNPTKSYSGYYISNTDLDLIEENIQIGDIIQIYIDNLNDNLDSSRFKVILDKNLHNICNVVVEYNYYNNGWNTRITDATLIDYERNIIELKIEDGTFDIEKCIITSIKTDNGIFDFTRDNNNIISIEKTYNNKPIKLYINGITKDLRSNIAQLNIEESTLYNTLVDRLIYLLKK